VHFKLIVLGCSELTQFAQKIKNLIKLFYSAPKSWPESWPT